MKARITKRMVDGISPPPRGKRIKVYDQSLTGFGLAVQPSGRKVFFIEYGPKGKRRRMTLGPYGPLTVDAARQLAIQKFGSSGKWGGTFTEPRLTMEGWAI